MTRSWPFKRNRGKEFVVNGVTMQKQASPNADASATAQIIKKVVAGLHLQTRTTAKLTPPENQRPFGFQKKEIQK